MFCAYCGNDTKGTKEHIISCAILDLFPECFATIDSIRNIVHMGDPIVKDVCANCNNRRISYIDSYAKTIVSDYFIQKYEKDTVLEFAYNYTLTQKVFLKYAYNDLRSHKDNTLFFSRKIVDFLMNEDLGKPLKNVTILAGLAVNTSPIPDQVFGDRKIRWSKNPAFLSNSIVEHLDYETGKIKLREKNPCQQIEGISLSYVFRMNSGQFLLVCWDDDISEHDLEIKCELLQYQYPYTILDPQGLSRLSRCTSEITYHFEKLIDVRWGQGIFDDITWMRGTYSDESQRYQKEIEAFWQKEGEKLLKAHPR